MTLYQWVALARQSWKKEEGQTMAEYGVILAVITVGIVAVLALLSGGITDAINNVVNVLRNP